MAQAPSARYLNMLVTGAIKIKLHEAYIDKLRAIETAELPQLEEHMTPKVLERIQARQFTQEDVVASKGKDPCYFVQKGAPNYQSLSVIVCCLQELCLQFGPR